MKSYLNPLSTKKAGKLPTRGASRAGRRNFVPYGDYSARVYPRLFSLSSYWLRQLLVAGYATFGKETNLNRCALREKRKSGNPTHGISAFL